jgi:hypothetical protein
MPPTLPIDSATNTLKEVLSSDPPHGAEVTYKQIGAVPGWY